MERAKVCLVMVCFLVLLAVITTASTCVVTPPPPNGNGHEGETEPDGNEGEAEAEPEKDWGELIEPEEERVGEIEEGEEISEWREVGRWEGTTEEADTIDTGPFQISSREWKIRTFSEDYSSGLTKCVRMLFYVVSVSEDLFIGSVDYSCGNELIYELKEDLPGPGRFRLEIETYGNVFYRVIVEEKI